jgi:fluoroquinolone transport system permease protein
MKNGMYGVYIFVNVIYIILLGYLPSEWKQTASTLLLLSDPTFLGMIFVGGILLLERNNSIPRGIGVSPLGSGGYIISKCISLMIIAELTAISIMLAGGIKITTGGLLAIMLCGSVFTMLGIMIGSVARNINHFILISVMSTIPASFPILTFYFAPRAFIFNWIPVYPVIRIINGTSLKQEFVLITLLIIWVVGVYKLTRKVVEDRIFSR